MPTATGVESRLGAAEVARAVLDQGQAADVAFESVLAKVTQSQDRALTRRLVHDLMRDWPMADALCRRLIERPFKRRDRLVFFILAVAITEMRLSREPAHAVVHCAVEATRLAKAEHLAKLVNALLRRFQREKAELEADCGGSLACQWGYPEWLIERFKQDWPEKWQALLTAGNASPPLTLRVNTRHWSRDQALSALADAGIEAKAMAGLPDAVTTDHRHAIRSIPQFDQGAWSVQDASAQWAIEWLALAPGLRVLDACAGPGGKAAHCLERADIELVAVESVPDRLSQLSDGLTRLGLSATTVLGDASQPKDWWDGQLFDRILIDAPCSATGVIRRHPDIRWLRQAKDLETLVALQAALLSGLWSLVKPGGILVYVTCSVLAVENHQQLELFLEKHTDAKALSPPQAAQKPPGRQMSVGWQVLPGEHDWDGFYFAAVERLPAD